MKIITNLNNVGKMRTPVIKQVTKEIPRPQFKVPEQLEQQRQLTYNEVQALQAEQVATPLSANSLIEPPKPEETPAPIAPFVVKRK